MNPFPFFFLHKITKGKSAKGGKRGEDKALNQLSSLQYINVNASMSSRMSELLSAYYGKAGGAEGNASGSCSDLDSSAFDAPHFVRDMLQLEGPEELLRQDDEMVHQVKKLDSDMQMLVYENYNKFITATDTIRKMKQNVEGMEKDMGALEDTMQHISEASEGIAGTLADKRGCVDKLVRVRRLLKRLQFLLELPDRLSNSLERGNISQAVSWYAMSLEILQSNTGIKSFGSILRESEEIMEGLGAQLEAKAASSPHCTPETEFVKTLYFLRQLAPPETLQDQFVTYYSALFDDWLDCSRRALVEDEGSSLDFAVTQLAKGFLPLLVRAQTAFTKLFGDSSCWDSTSSSCSHITHVGMRRLMDSGTHRFFELLEAKLDLCGAQPSPHSSSAQDAQELRGMVATLNQVTLDVQAVAGTLHSEELPPKCKAFVMGVMRTRIKNTFFGRLCRVTADAVGELIATASDDSQFLRLEGVRSTFKRLTGYQSLIGDVMSKLSVEAERAAAACKPLVEQDEQSAATGDEDRREIVEHVHKCMWGYFCWLDAHLRNRAGLETVETVLALDDLTGAAAASVTPSQHPACLVGYSDDFFPAPPGCGEGSQGSPPLAFTSPRALLTLASLCRQCAAHLVPNVAELLMRLLPAPDLDFDHAFLKHVDKTAKDLLSLYVETVGGGLGSSWGADMRICDWSALPIPAREGSEAILGIVDGIDRVAADVSAVLGGHSSRTPQMPLLLRDGAYRRTGGRQLGRKHGVQLDIDRIFSNDIEVLRGETGFSRDDILCKVLKIACKAASEHIRTVIFGPGGFQRMQVDVEILHQAAPAYIADSAGLSDLQSLLDSIMVSSRDRTSLSTTEEALLGLREEDLSFIAESCLTKLLGGGASG